VYNPYFWRKTNFLIIQYRRSQEKSLCQNQFNMLSHFDTLLACDWNRGQFFLVQGNLGEPGASNALFTFFLTVYPDSSGMVNSGRSDPVVACLSD